MSTLLVGSQTGKVAIPATSKPLVHDPFNSTNYVIHGSLGRGGYGEVYKISFSDDPTRFFAAKVFFWEKWADFQARMEAANLKRVKEAPHTIQLCSTNFTSKKPVIYTNYIAGITLLEHLKNCTHCPLDDIRKTVQILEFLAYIHKQNLCYFDLKPENVITDKWDMRIVDLGTLFDPSEFLGGEIGTAYYRSLPLWLNGPYDTTIDMWAFGLLLLELFVGGPLIAAKKGMDPGFDENNFYVNLIVSQFGMPPASLLEKLKDTALYFEKGEKGYTLKKPKQLKVKPWQTHINRIALLKKRDPSAVKNLINLIAGCMRYENPLTAEEALSHDFFVPDTRFSLKASDESRLRRYAFTVTKPDSYAVSMSLNLSDTFKFGCLHMKTLLKDRYTVTMENISTAKSVLECGIIIKNGDRLSIQKNAFGKWTISKEAGKQLPVHTTVSIKESKRRDVM